MRFTNRRRRQPPAIIIISLIDILIVLLIFMMVTTSFKQQPSVKLALPESKQAKQGSSEANLIVTIQRPEPHIFLDARPVTLAKLQEEFNARAAQNPKLSLSIRADTDAPFGEVIKVMDAAKVAKIRDVNAVTKTLK